MVGGYKLISSSLPITKSTGDTLDRGAFVKSLAKTILNYSFPSLFAIGLYEEWGSGKASSLSMVLETVADVDENAVTLKFSPWLCADPGQFITQFFKQMAATIRLKKPTAEKTWKLINQYADIFGIANLVPDVGSIFSSLSKVLIEEAREQVKEQARGLQRSRDQIIRRMMEEKVEITVSMMTLIDFLKKK